MQQWDNPIEKKLHKAFKTWILELSQNNPIAAQTKYKKTNSNKKELPKFGNFSGEAFCAVACIVSAIADFRHVSFAIGKTRVAPK